MPEVKCEVASCYYWAQGNHCAAEFIEVANTRTHRGGMEVGRLGNQAYATTSQETCCATFTPKEHGPKENVRRQDAHR